MLLKNLKTVYVYRPIIVKNYGETSLKWAFKLKKKLNVQQDINELDTNAAGIIDYDIIKIRTDYDIDINKNDGISLVEIDLDGHNYTENPPEYRVTKKLKVGNTTTFTCEIYHGE